MVFIGHVVHPEALKLCYLVLTSMSDRPVCVCVCLCVCSLCRFPELLNESNRSVTAQNANSTKYYFDQIVV